MTKTVDQALSTFIDDWNAGRRPDLDQHLLTVAQDERAELASAVATFLEYAPTPAYDDDALAELRADPALTAARERLLGPALPELVKDGRAAGKLGVADLARRIGETVGLTGREQRIAGYLERLEHNELDTRQLSRRLLDALANALGGDRDEFERASRRGLAPAGAMFRMDDPADAGQLLDKLEAVADELYSAAPAAGDEVDELFLGGR